MTSHSLSTDPLLSIIIPVFNEEAVIGRVILDIHDLNLTSYEVIVVDDGSSDATARVAEAAGAKVISHPYNIGNGAAIKTGIRNAHGAVLVFMDGDGQHNPDDIPRLVSFISKYHMVVGARDRGSERHAHRTMANWVFNKFASYVASFDIQDLTSGFRAMRREDALRFVDMFPNKFSYPSTSTLAFIRTGRSLKYIPIKTKYRVGVSKIKIFHDGPKFLMIIVKIAMSFSPLRVFVPASIALFILALGWYAFTYLTFGRFTNMSALLFSTSIIVFMLGLVAEQIASLRLEKGDQLYNIADSNRYKQFESYTYSSSSMKID